MRLTLWLVGLVLCGVAAVALYWQVRLGPILSAPDAELSPITLTLHPTPDGRPVDLGYVEFRVPPAFDHAPVRHGDSLFVSIRSNRPGVNLIIGGPVFDRDPKVRQLAVGLSQLDGHAAMPLYELRKAALHAQPFSVWAIPFRGFKRTSRDAALLVLKRIEVDGASRLEVFENDTFFVSIAVRPELTEIKLADKRARVEQSFLLKTGTYSPQDLASVLIGSYRVKSEYADEEALAEKLAATGIAVSPMEDRE